MPSAGGMLGTDQAACWNGGHFDGGGSHSRMVSAASGHGSVMRGSGSAATTMTCNSHCATPYKRGDGAQHNLGRFGKGNAGSAGVKEHRPGKE